MPIPVDSDATLALGRTAEFPDDARIFVHAPGTGGGGSEGGGLASIADLRVAFQEGVATLIDTAVATAVALLNSKQPVACATTANITLSGEQTIDGVLTSASRVLVKNQTAPAENGIYVSGAGAWTRATDADSSAELATALVPVEAGTVNADQRFLCTTNTPIVVGTDAMTWVNLSTALGISAAALTVLDDTTVAAMVDTLFGAASTGTGGAVRKTSPEINTTAGGYVKVADPAGDADGAVPKWILLANILSAINALPWKAKVVAASTANGTLATAFEAGDTMDGVVLTAYDRILLKNQTAGAENGIYEVQPTGAPVRTSDADSGAELVNAIVQVEKGTANANRIYQCTTDGTITVGVTALVWAPLPKMSSTFQATFQGLTADRTYALPDETATLASQAYVDAAAVVKKITQVVLASEFTDGGATVGTLILTPDVPLGAMLLGSKVTVEAGFAGDVTCLLQIGDGTDVDRYMTGTPSIFATAANGIQTGVPSGDKLLTAANTPTLTITSATDISLVIAEAGALTVTIYYIDTNL